MIVSLHGIGHDPEMQIDWWAGEHQPDGPPGRKGQAGATAISSWRRPGPSSIRKSTSTRPASMPWCWAASTTPAGGSPWIAIGSSSPAISDGGDAAWDIGVSHPDLWAGVIPISAEARNTCTFYTENARHVPFYVVLGELDGGRMARDAKVLDRYLKNGYNTTVVEYLGRGHEHFLDEQLPLFDWMHRCKRSFPLPREREGTHEREFECKTMRLMDNFFWWAQIESLPPNSTITGWTTAHEGKSFVTGSGLADRA